MEENKADFELNNCAEENREETAKKKITYRELEWAFIHK
jgi:hypothetical protein